jgi:hypothetical protein
MKAAVSTEGLGSAHERVVMSSGGHEFPVRDVMDAAWFRGELDGAWHRLLEEVGCEGLANERELEADDELLQTMSEEFRYERDLLTAEETERWLAARNLTEEDFSAYFMRRYWHDQLQKEADYQPESYPAAAPEMRELFRAEVIFSGELDRLARNLSWRLMSCSSRREEAPASHLSGNHGKSEPPHVGCYDEGEISGLGAVAAERERFLARAGLSEAELTVCLTQLGREQGWVNSCSLMEAAYRSVCEKVLNDEQRARSLAAMGLPLTRVELETFAARTLEAAKEAVLCLRGNEADMAALAAECGSTCVHSLLFLGDCPADLQRTLLCASPGETLEPEECDGGFTVCRLVRKWEPDLKDEEVRKRIDRHLLETHFAGLAGKQTGSG